MGFKLCFHDSDAEDHDLEKFEHAITKMPTSYGDVNTQRWREDTYLDEELAVTS